MRVPALRLLLAPLVLAVFAGCPPTYPKCDNDAQCSEKGEVCVQGQCQECATDNNCKPGFVCDANKCVPKPECSDKNPCKAGSKCKQGKCAVKGKGAAATCSTDPIRFEFNEAKLPAESQQALAGLAQCIKDNGWKLRLEGHADERGTEEYNLQLSNRRAASVKRYLIDLGVADSALETVGYGENKPAVSGSNEQAWAANRRVELVKR